MFFYSFHICHCSHNNGHEHILDVTNIYTKRLTCSDTARFWSKLPTAVVYGDYYICCVFTLKLDDTVDYPQNYSKNSDAAERVFSISSFTRFSYCSLGHLHEQPDTYSYLHGAEV